MAGLAHDRHRCLESWADLSARYQKAQKDPDSSTRSLTSQTGAIVRFSVDKLGDIRCGQRLPACLPAIEVDAQESSDEGPVTSNTGDCKSSHLFQMMLEAVQPLIDDGRGRRRSNANRHAPFSQEAQQRRQAA